MGEANYSALFARRDRTGARPGTERRPGGRAEQKRARAPLVALPLILALLAAGGTLRAAGMREAEGPSRYADARGGGYKGDEGTAARGTADLGDAGKADAAGREGAEAQAGGEAAAGGGEAPAYEYTEPDFGANRVTYPFLVLRTLAILAVIVIAIFFIFRVFLKNRNKIVAGTDIVKVLGTYPLSGNKSIQVIEIAEKVYILGITDSSINLITTMEDKETIDRIKLKSSKETKGFQSFKDQLLKLISGKAFTGQGQISNFSDFKQRINKMKKM